MTTRPTDPYDTVVVTMANITMLRVIKEAREARNEAINRANATRDMLIASANDKFISAVCSAAIDMDSSILALEDDGRDDDEESWDESE